MAEPRSTQSSTIQGLDSIQKIASDLSSIFPTIDHNTLVKHAQQGGSFDEALKLVLEQERPSSRTSEVNVTTPSSSISSYFPTSSDDLSSSKRISLNTDSLYLEELKSLYGNLLESTKKALDQDNFTDFHILKTFDKHGGDAQKVILELLSTPAPLNLSSSRDSLRASASLRMSLQQMLNNSADALKSSSGLEQLPVNVDLSMLDVDDNEETSSTPLPPLMTREEIEEEEKAEEILRMSANLAEQSSQSSEEKNDARSSSSDSSTPNREYHPVQPVTNKTPKHIQIATAKASEPQYFPSNIPVSIVNKENLKTKDHDADALASFLISYGGRDISKEKQLARDSYRKVGYDDVTMMGMTIRQLRQFHKAQNSAGKSATSRPKRAALEQKEEIPSVQQQLTTMPDDMTPPIQLVDISAFIETLDQDSLQLRFETCAQAQLDEINELKYIFTSDQLQISESSPMIVSISLAEPAFETTKIISANDLEGQTVHTAELNTTVSFKNLLLLQLVLILPPLYPEVAPVISIRSLSRSWSLPEHIIQRLVAHLQNEAEINQPYPSIFALHTAAEAWLNSDEEIKQLALQESSHNRITGDTSLDSHLFDSIKLIFDFQSDCVFHRFEDILNQRSKVLKRAIKVLLNSPAATGLPPPILYPSETGEFPVCNLIGDIDEKASLKCIGLTTSSVRILLQKYDWRVAELSSAYLKSITSGSYDNFLKSAGVLSNVHSAASSTIDWMETVECPTCMDDVPMHKTFRLGCLHFLCNSCYSDYCEVQVSSNQHSSFNCPAPNCLFMVDQASLVGLISAKRWKQYTNMVVTQYVQSNPGLKWCPSKIPCDYIAQTEPLEDGYPALNQSNKEVAPEPHSIPAIIQCRCSHTYCSLCNHPGGHYPATCDEIKQWNRVHPNDIKPSEDDEASVRVIRSITRSCPKCQIRISKSGGCPHMVCKQCSYEFCWVCFAAWSYQHYNCDQSGFQISEEAKAYVAPTQNFDSLLIRLRNISYDLIFPIAKQKLIEAMSTKAKPNKPNIRALTHEDVDMMITALELIYTSQYLVTNACKAASPLTSGEVMATIRHTPLFQAINRVIQDITFLGNLFQTNSYRKELISHIIAGVRPLKQGLKQMLKQLMEVRIKVLTT